MEPSKSDSTPVLGWAIRKCETPFSVSSQPGAGPAHR